MVFSFQFSCLQIYLKAYRLSEFNFLFILKVANIRCFILIAVEIFHNIIQPRTKETRRCLIFFHPGKNSINVDPSNIHTTWPWTHSGKRLCLCEIVFDEENVGCAKIKSWKNKNIDGFYTKMTQKGGFSKLYVKIKKRCYAPFFNM